jgi:hypothetical protein
MLNYLVILFRCREKNIRFKYSSCVFSSSSVREPMMHLDVNHEKALDALANGVSSLSMSRRSDIPSARDSYSNKLIMEWKVDLTM